MDETELKAYRGPHVFYTSLEEQHKAAAALKKGLRPPRLPISDEHETYNHLSVKLGQHWAAIQLATHPFSVRGIPGQKFHSSRFRYSLCCEQAVAQCSSTKPICDAVQNVYDAYYQLTPWGFSNEDL
jgi:hypothetical protein